MFEINPGFVGLLIRRERLARGWSQAGLCKGICAVSYLSKIEQGKASPSDEVVTLLLERLGVSWHTGETSRNAGKLASELFDAFCAMDGAQGERLCAELDEHPQYIYTDSMLDLLLLRGMYRKGVGKELDAFAPVMDEQQRSLLHLLHEEYRGPIG